MEKQNLFRIWVKKSYLVTLRKCIWYLKLNFPRTEENIRDCFVDQVVNFNYPKNVNEFDDLLATYRRKKSDYIKNNLGENMNLEKIILMDVVSGLADRLEEFTNFLTVSRKYGLSCVYIFHTIYPTRQNW